MPAGVIRSSVGQLAQERVGVELAWAWMNRRLGLDRGDDRRVAVTGAGDGDAGGEVEVRSPAPVVTSNPHPTRRRDR